MLNAFLLYHGLRKIGVYQPNHGWLSFFGRLLVANGVLLAILIYLTPDIAAWQQANVWLRAQWLAMLICGSALAYFVALRLCGIKLKALVKPADSL
jgi:putative peptidoglycan lipid II flippase